MKYIFFIIVNRLLNERVHKLSQQSVIDNNNSFILELENDNSIYNLPWGIYTFIITFIPSKMITTF